MKNILTNVINPVSCEVIQFLPEQVISIEGSKITAIIPKQEFQGIVDEDLSHQFALPGFIDLHIHLSQYYIRGLYEPALLPWLNKYVFRKKLVLKIMNMPKSLVEIFFLPC